MIYIIIVAVIAILTLVYRANSGQKIYSYVKTTGEKVYSKYTPYSYDEIKEKTKELGHTYSKKTFYTQAVLLAIFAFGITYLYFYSITISAIYAFIVTLFIPYFSYLGTKKVYNEFLFEQIQIYTTNVIMEFQVTKSFVKSLEGVYQSGVVDDPIQSDIKVMIDMAYANGMIEPSIDYMNSKYDYYITKNMHQLFLQITSEGAHNVNDALDNMLNDIDMLVEAVYRDRLDRAQFHRQFLQFGIILYLLIMLIQLMIGKESYLNMISLWYIQILVHFVILFNTYFLFKGEKYYNENVGVE